MEDVRGRGVELEKDQVDEREECCCGWARKHSTYGGVRIVRRSRWGCQKTE